MQKIIAKISAAETFEEVKSLVRGFFDDDGYWGFEESILATKENVISQIKCEVSTDIYATAILSLYLLRAVEFEVFQDN